MSNSGFNSGSGSGIGTTGNVTTGPGNSGTGINSGSMGGSSMGGSSTGGGSTGGSSTGSSDFSTSGGFNTQSGTDAGICPHCGQSTSGRSGLEQLLGRLGITDEMVNNLKGQFQNVDIDEYLNTARTYLKDGGTKAQAFAKDNPGKVAAGVAALALGAGLIYAAVNRDKA